MDHRTGNPKPHRCVMNIRALTLGWESVQISNNTNTLTNVNTTDLTAVHSASVSQEKPTKPTNVKWDVTSGTNRHSTVSKTNTPQPKSITYSLPQLSGSTLHSKNNFSEDYHAAEPTNSSVFGEKRNQLAVYIAAPTVAVLLASIALASTLRNMIHRGKQLSTERDNTSESADSDHSPTIAIPPKGSIFVDVSHGRAEDKNIYSLIGDDTYDTLSSSSQGQPNDDCYRCEDFIVKRVKDDQIDEERIVYVLNAETVESEIITTDL